MDSGARSQFVVSAVLKRVGPGVIIKLVQSQVVARNADEALGLTLRSVKAEYPGYTVLDTLASEIAMQGTPCVNRARPDLRA